LITILFSAASKKYCLQFNVSQSDKTGHWLQDQLIIIAWSDDISPPHGTQLEESNVTLLPPCLTSMSLPSLPLAAGPVVQINITPPRPDVVTVGLVVGHHPLTYIDSYSLIYLSHLYMGTV